MVDIKEKEFVLTELGDIYKVKEVHQRYITVEKLNEELPIAIIDKHSFNILDLLEENDFVNSYPLKICYDINGNKIYRVNSSRITPDNVYQVLTRKKFYDTSYDLLNEESIQWKEVYGYPRYLISNEGNIKEKKTGRLMTISKVNYTNTVKLRNNEDKIKTEKVSILLLNTYVGRMKDMTPEYIDGNPDNCILSNLRWGKIEKGSKTSRKILSDVEENEYNNIVCYYYDKPIFKFKTNKECYDYFYNNISKDIDIAKLNWAIKYFVEYLNMKYLVVEEDFYDKLVLNNDDFKKYYGKSEKEMKLYFPVFKEVDLGLDDIEPSEEELKKLEKEISIEREEIKKQLFVKKMLRLLKTVNKKK